MKKVILTFFVLIIIIFFSCNKQKIIKVNSSDIGFVPQVQFVEFEENNLQINNDIKIVFSNENNELSKIADYLTEYFFETYNLSLKKSNKEIQGINVLSLLINPKLKNEEAYNLTIDNSGIKIEGKTARAVFYGVQTFMQIFPSKKQKASFEIPFMEIKDYPQFAWRGMHLDVCRHFYSVEFVKKTIDLIASLKMNTFHWHLTDDQGWRIEIKKYPKLTEIGAWRNKTVVGHMLEHPLKFKEEKYGGFYTQEEIKEVVRYAKSRYVTVIPEIEMPGHAVAALSAYPEYSCTGGSFEVFPEWGVSNDVYCAGKDETFVFIEDVLSEVIELFPSEYFHIGGDECPKTRWKECKDCQTRIKNEGLKDEHELQSYFIKRIEKFINSKGKKLIGWDEILEGGLPERASVMSWRGEEGGIEAASKGHYVVMSPNATNYFDHYQGKYNEPLAIGGLTDMREVYDYKVIPKELKQEYKKYILGSQANLWSEYIVSDKQMEYMIFPRLCAMAENLWTNENIQNWDDFITRMDAEYLRLDLKNVNYRVNPPTGYEDVNKFYSDSILVQLNCNIATAQIRYTLDGSEPSENSNLYKEPFYINLDKKVTLKSKTIMPNGKFSSVMNGTFEKLVLLNATNNSSLKNGLNYKYFEAEFNSAKRIDNNEVTKKGFIDNFTYPKFVRQHFFGIIYSGFINVSDDDVYIFHVGSNDGAILYIDDELVCNNDGFKWFETKSGKIALKKGLHKIQLNYFQAKYGYNLKVEIESNKIKKQTILNNILFHQN